MFRTRSPEEKVARELATMKAERADNERDMIGLAIAPPTCAPRRSSPRWVRMPLNR